MLTKADILQKIAESDDGRISAFHGQVIGEVAFQNHTFDRPVNFNGAIFSGPTDFSGATFREFSSFDSTVFKAPALFQGSCFSRGASFSLAAFETAEFFQARFEGRALFWHASFHGQADFSQAKFCRASVRPGEHPGEVNFSWARFLAKALFTYAEFETPVYLHRTLFGSDAHFDSCKFLDAVFLNGKQNDVLFPRFGDVNPETIGELELAGLFRPDLERHQTYRGQRLSEFVCFNNVYSEADLGRKLGRFAISPSDIAAIATGWREGAHRMFSPGRLLTFRGTRFAALDRLHCAYLDLADIILDRQIDGSAEERKQFDTCLRANLCDVFLSHASEDKTAVARPLSARLREMGFSVWLDESAMEIGDTLTTSLEDAMQQCRNGIVILSPDYIRKDWTQRELERLLELSAHSEKKLFFIWHKLDEGQVGSWSSKIAGRVAYNTDRFTIEELADKLASVIHRAG